MLTRPSTKHLAHNIYQHINRKLTDQYQITCRTHEDFVLSISYSKASYQHVNHWHQYHPAHNTYRHARNSCKPKRKFLIAWLQTLANPQQQKMYRLRRALSKPWYSSSTVPLPAHCLHWTACKRERERGRDVHFAYE